MIHVLFQSGQSASVWVPFATAGASAIISAGTALLVARQIMRPLAQRSMKSAAQYDLIRQRNELNDAGVQFVGVRGPMETEFGISDKDLAAYQMKSALFCRHLGLLEDVFQRSDVLGDQKKRDYGEWAVRVIKPWVDGDPDIRKILRYFYETGDLLDRDFIAWLKSLIPMSCE